MVQNAIDIQHVSKTYAATGKQKAKKALDDIILGVPRGSMFALLGPNGAGKSTLINILAGTVVKSSGSVKIWDRDIDDNPRNAKAAIGIVSQEIVMDPFFTPREALEIQAGFFGVPNPERRTNELLEMVGLQDKADAWSRSLSGGMKRRLMVAKAMVHNPPVLILDEPTAGVDIELRQQLWENVQTLNNNGTTVLLTTHYLEEAEKLCNKVAIINQGKLVACDNTEDLLARVDTKEIRFRVSGEIKEMPASLELLGAKKQGKRTLVFHYSQSEQSVAKILKEIQQTGFDIIDVKTEESDLEDVFLQITKS